MSCKKTSGTLLVNRLEEAIRASERIPTSGARALPIIRGIEPNGTTTKPLENVLDEMGQILLSSGIIFKYGKDVIATAVNGPLPLTEGPQVESHTAAYLANYFVCEGKTSQFPPPSGTIATLFKRIPFLEQLPVIKQIANRPVFSATFTLLRPGYHAEEKILVLGDEIPTDKDSPPCSPGSSALERLPTHLREVLRDFPFRSEADLVNGLAFLLTGFLTNHFIDSGKPLTFLDGNRPGVGKTLFLRTSSLILDGIEPAFVQYSANDEELNKRIGANLRDPTRSILAFDNVRNMGQAPLNSPLLEGLITSGFLSLRILGKSQNIERRNDLLWATTMNDTQVGPDLASRGIPVRFHVEGNPEELEFDGRDPLRYAKVHRAEILAELAAMVTDWVRLGKPKSCKKHRMQEWAETVGGILEANGYPEFLDNQQEASLEFNAEFAELRSLAEEALAQGGPAQIAGANHDTAPPQATTSKGWVKLFVTVGLLADKLGSSSESVKSACVGKYLSKHVGKSVSIEYAGKIGTASLCKQEGRSRAVLYWFDVKPLEDESVSPAASAEETTPPRKERLHSSKARAPSRKVASDGGTMHPKKPASKTEEGHAGQTTAILAAGKNQKTTGGNQLDW